MSAEVAVRLSLTYVPAHIVDSTRATLQTKSPMTARTRLSARTIMAAMFPRTPSIAAPRWPLWARPV